MVMLEGNVGSDFFEGPIALLPVGDILRIRDIVLVGLRAGFPDHDQAVGVRERQRPKQYSIDDAENGSVRADSENQSQQRHAS